MNMTEKLNKGEELSCLTQEAWSCNKKKCQIKKNPLEKKPKNSIVPEAYINMLINEIIIKRNKQTKIF